MDNRDNEILAEIRRRLPEDIEATVKTLMVYGSRARGDATADSDLDVVALVEEKTAEIEQRLEDVVYGVMWDYDFTPVISLKVFAYDRFHHAAAMGFSFYRNVLTQGQLV